MRILGIDPGPVTHGAVVYDTDALKVSWASKAATALEIHIECAQHPVEYVLIERPAAMGTLGVGIVGHLLDTAWAAGELAESFRAMEVPLQSMTRRQVLRSLGVMAGRGSADSRVRAACILDHQVPGGPSAIGKKANPGPLYGVSSHAWQALGLVLAWIEENKRRT